MLSASRRVWWSSNKGLVLGHSLGPLVPVEGNVKTTAYKGIITLLHQLGEGSFLFQHENMTVHKARFTKLRFGEFGEEELERLSQSPDLNPTKLH